MTQERPTVSAGSIIPKIFGISCNNGKTTNLSISGMVLQSPTGHMKKVLGSVMGKKLDQVDIPGFIPDSEEIRGDMLDYAVEIEWADSHLCQMINHLDSIGELNNTIIIVTADNGMPFPRAKANCFEYGIHIPMAISYPNGFPAGRRVDDLISFIDLAPTILELAGIKPEGMQPLSGKSIVNILNRKKVDS
mgnify:CR=1 FL=1